MVKGENCLQYDLTEIDFKGFDTLYQSTLKGENSLHWPSVFMHPSWLQAWWEVFGFGARLNLLIAKRDGQVVGAAPLMVKEGDASFVGSPDVCDYLDFITVPGTEEGFFNCLLDYLDDQQVGKLQLHSLRPASTVLSYLKPAAEQKNMAVKVEQEGVSAELQLPGNWEGYLSLLNKKQRHEVRRKMRRLKEGAEVNYRIIQGGGELERYFSLFMKMFKNNPEKEAFLTPVMETFFTSAVPSALRAGLMKIGILELDSRPAAAILFFDYNGGFYLYNSGYDSAYSSFSAGLISKVFSIKEAIEQGREVYDFLKGDEGYKYRLGGRQIPVYCCTIELRS